MNNTSQSLCPCGSVKKHAECCGRFISGEKIAPTPEVLMRSRYAAFVMGDVAYIARTMKGVSSQNFNPEATRLWLQQVKWIKLEILAAPPIDEKNPTQGFVEFIAYYFEENQIQYIHEVSQFERDGLQWFYVSGKHYRQSPKVANKLGRNDPCPCQSGKKYKNCCSKT